ncbi:hypothetical protein [Yinghuangia soli]|uniref:Uncharacterized protein n=1 Tax=Yinghuangia soli TaxID=2908204 RepID=A0AA41PU96_9ACTN|nr:hypothetical protein [Yinghuangia soli]MCF2525843.1 hypothetical protein [Yinghuangia soli]
MSGRAKALWWGLAGAGAVAFGVAVVWLTVGHPEGAGQAWAIVGSLAGVASLGISLWQVSRAAASTGGGNHALTAATTPVSTPAVQSFVPPGAPYVSADRGSIAAGGTIRNAQTRYSATDSGTDPASSTAPDPAAPTSQPGGPGIRADRGSIAAGGDIDGSTTHYGP